MNRFMVWTVFGSMILACSTASSETPHYVRSVAATSATTSSPIRWHDTLESGWAEARRLDLPMVIYITSEHCPYCDAMKRDTWQDRSVRDRLADGFVAIRLTPKRNAATLGRVNIRMYPTTLVGVPRGKVVGHRFGYQPPGSLHQLLGETERLR